MLDSPPSVEPEPRFAASAPKTLFNIKRESRPNPLGLEQAMYRNYKLSSRTAQRQLFLTTAQKPFENCPFRAVGATLVIQFRMDHCRCPEALRGKLSSENNVDWTNWIDNQDLLNVARPQPCLRTASVRSLLFYISLAVSPPPASSHIRAGFSRVCKNTRPWPS